MAVLLIKLINFVDNTAYCLLYLSTISVMVTWKFQVFKIQTFVFV